MAGAGSRSVPFAVAAEGAYAVQLRLTPALLDALQQAQDGGDAASIRFGEGPQGNVIQVGDASFRFTALEERSCDLLSMPAGGAAPASLVGAVQQKLFVARSLEDERLRVRARGEEAERRGHERKAQLLDGKPKPKAGGGAGKKAGTTTVRRVTPPPAAAAQQPLTASMLAPPPAAAARPPVHPLPAGQQQQQHQAAPAAAAAAPSGKPMHKSASTGKLGLAGKGAQASLPQTASQRVLQAARAGATLRLVLLAILAERPMAKGTVRAVLADVAARVKSFKKPQPQELERALKAVADFRSPGLYHVYSMLLPELDALPSGPAAAPAGGRSGRSASPSDQQQHAPSPPASAEAGPSREGKAAAAGAAKQGRASAPASGTKRGRDKLDWTDDDSDADALPPPPAAQRVRQQPGGGLPKPRAASEPVPAAAYVHASAASPPSVGGGPGAVGGHSSSSDRAGGIPRPGVRRTSSSRGSDGADDSWIEEHADRQPEPAAPIASKEEYRAREAAFAEKYRLYFELHQLIEAHKKDCEALAAAVQAAGGDAERERLRLELERLTQRRAERAKRWDAAYRVLHQELAAAKSRMAEFVQQLQQARRSATPDALPAVRVQ